MQNYDKKYPLTILNHLPHLYNNSETNGDNKISYSVPALDLEHGHIMSQT